VPPVAFSAAEYDAPAVPGGNEESVVIANAPGLLIVMLNGCVAVRLVGVVESVTTALKLNWPAQELVGVPVMAPVLGLRAKHEGNGPVVLQV
jgi:hypothetical protein